MKSIKSTISCSELLKLIPDDLIEKIEKETKVNHQVKKLTGLMMFKLILFSLLSTGRTSLRVMEEIYNSEKFKVLTSRKNGTTKHTTISDRIANINYVFFKEIFEFLYNKSQSILDNQKDTLSISRYDSTLVSLSAKLLKTGLCSTQETKRQIKFTVGLKDDLPCSVKTFTSQRGVTEEVALKEAILSSKHNDNSIVVFDRGLQSRKAFVKFNDKNIQFVTRLRKKTLYKEIKQHKKIHRKKTKNLILDKDIIVNLKDGYNWIDKEFRMIKAHTKDEDFIFLTNIFDFTAKEITEIYKMRWDIEVFFKFIKQELNFSHLVSRTENGIKVMLYMTLILAILLTVYKVKNCIKSYKIAKIRFFNELEMLIIYDIVSVCDGDITKLDKLKSHCFS